MIDFIMNFHWMAVGQIVLIDILLGGDNAIVIALACRNLPHHMRFKGILWGTAGAITIRLILIAFAVTLLELPFVKLVGGALLFYIGIKLLTDHDTHEDVKASNQLWGAVKTIIVADLAMSIDNVIAIASAASHAHEDHQFLLVLFGIILSIPIIVWGSTLVLKLMEKFPVIVTFGAALLGYLAGSMLVSDKIVAPWLHNYISEASLLLLGKLSTAGVIGAVIVVVIGKYVQRRNKSVQSNT